MCFEKIVFIRMSFGHTHQPCAAAIFINNFRSFWLYFYIIEAMCFCSIKLDTSFSNLR